MKKTCLKEKLISIYKKKQGRFAGKIPAVQGIFHTERQGSPNLQKQEKSNEKEKVQLWEPRTPLKDGFR